MSPKISDKFFRKFEPALDAKESAVLVLIHENEGKPNLLFTLRSELISHSGQISFPGGRCEAGESYEMTALREANEETGLQPADVKILGRLTTLYVPPSNSNITPIVGFIKTLPELTRNGDEVQEIFSVPIQEFMLEKSIIRETWDINGNEIEVPFWRVHRTTPLWGATAMMVMELVSILNDGIHYIQ